MTTKESFGARVVRLRLTKGIRYQKDFAPLIGIDVATLNQIERDKRSPRIETLSSMAAVLGVSRDLLIDGEPGEPAQAPPLRPPKEPRKPAREEASPVERVDISAAVQEAVFGAFASILVELAESFTARHEANAPRETRGSGARKAARAARG